jgi:hypothetical protein
MLERIRTEKLDQTPESAVAGIVRWILRMHEAQHSVDVAAFSSSI